MIVALASPRVASTLDEGLREDRAVPVQDVGPGHTIYFASVNHALRFQESATSLIDPSGRCQAHLPYGQEGVLVQSIDVEAATRLLAARNAPERYREFRPA